MESLLNNGFLDKLFNTNPLEAVPATDNVIFVTIVAGKLSADQRKKA